MAENWKTGDLAVCVSNQWFRGGLLPMLVHPTKEQILRVAGVKTGSAACGCGKCFPNTALLLNFTEFGDEWWLADGFRKIKPDGTDEKIGRQEGVSWFKRLLKHHKAKEPETV